MEDMKIEFSYKEIVDTMIKDTEIPLHERSNHTIIKTYLVDYIWGTYFGDESEESSTVATIEQLVAHELQRYFTWDAQECSLVLKVTLPNNPRIQ